MESNTTATESNTTAALRIPVESNTTATERNTTATPMTSNTTATLPIPTERNATATLPIPTERNATATPVESNARGMLLVLMESNTTATLPTVPTKDSATPAPNATHMVPVDTTMACAGNCTNPATETAAVMLPSHRNTTVPTTTSGPGSTTVTTRSSSTSRANTSSATLCLYLPHGSNPPAIICRNGGVANLTECLCPPGYSGPTCETVNTTNQCAGGSTAGGTRCICPPGRSGSRCDTPDEATACRNGGTAVGTECYCPDPCQNGGHWTGVSCVCPPNLTGAFCQFGASTINITAELGPSVMMLAHVTNRNFSEDMEDTSSTAYRSFVDEFSRTMDRIYHNVSGYRGTHVLTLTRGSVVVNYKVLLQPSAGDTDLDHRAKELLEVANAAAQPQNCSDTAAARAEESVLNAMELCRKYAPANFSRHYSPYRLQNSLLCITNCTLNVPGSINCNSGLCRLTPEGPHCFCPDVPWYLTTGSRCQIHISKLGLGLGLGLTLLILLILCVILTICLAQGKKKSAGTSPPHKTPELTGSQLYSMTGEDSSWPDGRRNGRATGIYHVNGRGSTPRQGRYGHSSYKPNAEVAAPTTPVMLGAYPQPHPMPPLVYPSPSSPPAAAAPRPVSADANSPPARIPPSAEHGGWRAAELLNLVKSGGDGTSTSAPTTSASNTAAPIVTATTTIFASTTMASSTSLPQNTTTTSLTTTESSTPAPSMATSTSEPSTDTTTSAPTMATTTATTTSATTTAFSTSAPNMATSTSEPSTDTNTSAPTTTATPSPPAPIVTATTTFTSTTMASSTSLPTNTTTTSLTTTNTSPPAPSTATSTPASTTTSGTSATSTATSTLEPTPGTSTSAPTTATTTSAPATAFSATSVPPAAANATSAPTTAITASANSTATTTSARTMATSRPTPNSTSSTSAISTATSTSTPTTTATSTSASTTTASNSSALTTTASRTSAPTTNSSSITFSTTTATTSTDMTASTVHSSSPITSTTISHPNNTTSPPTTTTSSTANNSPSIKPATSSPPTTTFHPAATPGICHNGGTWVGGHCKCPAGFTGDTCDEISNTIETNAVTNGTVQVKLRVTNWEFTSDLGNTSTSAYWEFVKNFTTQMNVVYSNIQGYKGIQVLQLMPGSVVVDHIVIISLLVTAQTQEKLDDIVVDLRKQIDVAVAQNCRNDTYELCFDSSRVMVGNASFNFSEEGFCQQEVPEGYQDYYFPNLTSSGFYCVSNCTPGTAGTIDCNKGRCQLTPSGPQCFCHETDIYWYQGDRCKARVSKLAVGLGLAVAILAATVAVLTVFLFRAQRTGSFYSTQKAMKERWYEDAVETWSLPGSFTLRNEDAQREDNLDSADTSAPVKRPRLEKFFTRL
ncbi:PREDICTED: mucin-3B-like [Nipponia nippon]|uniref:mucin-3B-like n=1 Tax=Nipponia nippon TaxID=128390 RepID=UPI000510B2EA|nr:PREDICTED: mucin-3B-like [Nipponia nippon]